MIAPRRAVYAVVTDGWVVSPRWLAVFGVLALAAVVGLIVALT